MINNQPSANDYKDVAFECLIQAYKNICKVDNEEFEPSIDRDELWEYNKIVLKTSVILTHQGIEALLKSKISEKTPLLLIEQKRAFWKTLPESDDCDFSDLYTISGDELIRTFFATVNPANYDADLVDHIENVRTLRNELVHGVGNQALEPESILVLILRSFTKLCGQDSFWAALQNKFYSHPGQLTGEPTFVFDEAQQHIHLEYLEALLGTGELNNHFSQDLRARRYFCPECTGSKGVSVTGGGEVKPYPYFRYTFLSPNEPGSTNAHCLICNQDFEVERTDCNKEHCKGNVIFIDHDEEEIDEDTGNVFVEASRICLTCDEDQ